MTSANVTASVFAELNDKGTRINVHFQYDANLVRAVKTIPGGRFTPAANGGPFWHLPLDLVSARALRTAFGNDLTLGAALKAWGHEEVQLERNLTSLTTSDDHPLEELQLAHRHPLLANYLRPYQRADVAMMAQANVLNANQPGTGKTVEVIAAVQEAGLVGPHLVCAPVRSLENVWRKEIEKWDTEATVYTAEDLAARKVAVAQGLAAAARGERCWVLVNPEMIRLERLGEDSTAPVVKRDHKGCLYGARDDLHRQLLAVDWDSFTIDEFHKSGLSNTAAGGNAIALFKLGAQAVKSQRRFALSGTPMGGKPIKLFPVLQWLEPQTFSSKWRWAEQWLDIDDNGYGKKIGGIREGQDEPFYTGHARYMVRRLKREALPGLPPKQIVEVECGMTAKQAKQYAKFAKDAEVRIAEASGTGDQRVAATCVLAEWARLKQFANAYCELDDKGAVQPTTLSGKLPHLLDRLDEFGIRKADPEPGARAIVASESKRMINMVAKYLSDQGIAVGVLTGDTKDSTSLVDRFQGGDPTAYVLCMTTQTGGVSLNLEAAGSVHILDETWNPDDQEQLEDRGDRGSRTTPLVCLYYRTAGTVQQYVAEMGASKRLTNSEVLDLHRLSAKAS